MSDSFALEDAANVVERGLGLPGGERRSIIVQDDSEVDVRFANNTTTTNGVRRDRTVSIVSIFEGKDGARVGVASQSGAVDIEELLAKAQDEARRAPLAEDAISEARSDPVTDGDFGQPFSETSLSVLVPTLEGLVEVFARARDAKQIAAGFATHTTSTTYLGTSNGDRRRHVQPTGTIELSSRANEGASSWAGQGTEDFTDVDIAGLGETVRQRLGWASRKIELDAGRYEVILPPDAVADLIIEIDFAASGRQADDGGSVFSSMPGKNRVGERLCDVPFNLWSDPLAPGISCVPFVATASSGTDESVFDNGQAVERTDWIEDGTLERLRYHRAGAKRAGAKFTPSVDNLLLSAPGPGKTLEDLIKGTDRALLLTCLWYIREVDPATLLLTGLTRDGVYLVERGEVVGAVNNFRFNESPLDVLAHATEVGMTRRALSREWGEWLSRTAMPALRVEGFNMSSVSKAN